MFGQDPNATAIRREIEESDALDALDECREELGIEARELHRGPFFLTVTETVGITAGHTDVSLWYVLKGNRCEQLEFDRTEFRRIRWLHRDSIPLERADPELGRFLTKLYGEGGTGDAAEKLSARHSARPAVRRGAG